eukprot:TRINITY_DN14716_c0_g1_i1.p1 TRINITY_DN14716_c0_g1~~TRINITY_DN14716_c0_g1_i1.p1  ORF type:complete len:488 (-),score=57.96 TRINITY_DN14716_c0_g1_i1:52-1515(-)
MGIKGLLKALEGVQRDCHVEEFEGLRVAVDAHGWLHAALAAYALDIAKGSIKKPHVGYCMRRVAMLKRCGLSPVLVFDGDLLPAKLETRNERLRRRCDQREEGERCLRQGDLVGAKSCLAQAVEVEPQHVAEVIEELSHEGTPFIVAPYEADAQIVYLSLHGLVDICISEDSDLLALGCHRVLYKMNAHGQGREILLEDALDGRSLEEFQSICILMGCDYLPKLTGVGPTLALALVDACGNDLRSLIQEMRRRDLPVPADYLHSFQQTQLVFQHQVVVNPVTGHRIPLRPPSAGTELPLAAGVMDDSSCMSESAMWDPDQSGHILESHRSRSRDTKRSRSRSNSRCQSTEVHMCQQGRMASGKSGQDAAKASFPCGEPEFQIVPIGDSSDRWDSGEPPRCPAGSGSAFISDSWTPAKLCRNSKITLDDFLHRERRGAPAVELLHRYNESALPDEAPCKNSRFFGPWGQRSGWDEECERGTGTASLWS